MRVLSTVACLLFLFSYAIATNIRTGSSYGSLSSGGGREVNMRTGLYSKNTIELPEDSEHTLVKTFHLVNAARMATTDGNCKANVMDSSPECATGQPNMFCAQSVCSAWHGEATVAAICSPDDHKMIMEIAAKLDVDRTGKTAWLGRVRFGGDEDTPNSGVWSWDIERDTGACPECPAFCTSQGPCHPNGHGTPIQYPVEPYLCGNTGDWRNCYMAKSRMNVLTLDKGSVEFRNCGDTADYVLCELVTSHCEAKRDCHGHGTCNPVQICSPLFMANSETPEAARSCKCENLWEDKEIGAGIVKSILECAQCGLECGPNGGLDEHKCQCNCSDGKTRLVKCP